jgi:mRNA interferase RelE/StbE
MYRVEISKRLYRQVKKLEKSKKILEIFKNLKFFGSEELDLDIKKLKGSWTGYYRIRLGSIRVIFYKKNDLYLKIYKVGFRGNVYS